MLARLHGPIAQLVLFGVLLVYAPFVMLLNYLQRAVAQLSQLSLDLGVVDVPLVLGLFLVACGTTLALLRRQVTLYRLAAAGSCLALIAIAQGICDIYLDAPCYEIQQNWHYAAYVLFAQLALRALHRQPEPRRLLGAFAIALALSTFDEGFQFFVHERVFDLNDIAKDAWGTLIGLTIHLFVIHEGRTLGPEPVRQRRLTGYLRSARAVYALLLLFTCWLLASSSLLSELRYWPYVVLLTLAASALTFGAVHGSQRASIRVGLLSLGAGAALALTVSVACLHDTPIAYQGKGLVVYRGVPLPLFDLMVFPDGCFRPMDKKPSFNPGDRSFILRQRPDVAIIGSGSYGRGGGGFAPPRSRSADLVYNASLGRPTQIIVVPNAEATAIYNRLVREGRRRVLLVIHHEL